MARITSDSEPTTQKPSLRRFEISKSAYLIDRANLALKEGPREGFGAPLAPTADNDVEEGGQ